METRLDTVNSSNVANDMFHNAASATGWYRTEVPLQAPTKPWVR